MGSVAPKIQVVIGSGRVFDRWTQVGLNLRMASAADAFSLTHVDARRLEVSDPMAAEVADSINGGERVQVKVNGKTEIDGFVTTVDLAEGPDGDEIVTVGGTSATSDLVDCAAYHMGGSDAQNIRKAVKILQTATTVDAITRAALALKENLTGEWEQSTFPEMAKEICAPFGIEPVAGDGAVGPVELAEINKRAKIPFRRACIEPGETAFEFLDKLARERGLTLTCTPDGDLAYTVSGARKILGVLEQGRNIGKGGTRREDVRDRFHHYRVYGQSAGDDAWHGEDARGGEGTAEDEAVKRYRPMVIISDGTASDGDFADRATWERNRRAARSRTASIPVLSWLDPEKNLWRPNRLIEVKWPKKRIEGEVLIEGVRLAYDIEDGDVGEVQIVAPGAYDPLQAPKTRRNRKLWVDWSAP